MSTGAGTSVAEIPNVRLRLSNRAENVLIVRQALAGLAEAIDLDPVELNDVSTAVSEACNNVVLHAYAGREGPLEVEIYAYASTLEVVVRDDGEGIQPQDVGDEPVAGGIGLPVIRALTQSVELRDLDGAGTEVRMRFAVAHARVLARPEEQAPDDPPARATAAARASGTLSMLVGPPVLARAVFPRVLSALAARAYFSTDRISDMQLLADAIVAHAESALSASRLNVEVELQPRSLGMRIGPLRPGGAEAVLSEAALDGLGAVLERLTDSHEVSRDGASETLGLNLIEPR